MRLILSFLLILILPPQAKLFAALPPNAEPAYDLCIYGGTSGGVVAAVQASRMGKKVVLVEPGKHLGGMTSGGLSAVDIGDPRTVGGIAREYFTRLVASYGKKLNWDEPFKGSGGPPTGGAYSIEPHVAEKLFDDLVREANVTVLRSARLAKVVKEGTKITALQWEDGRSVQAKMFLDTTYEGDLMAAAGVSFTLTREGNAKYGEQYNGIHYTDKYKPRTNHQKPGANGRVPGGQGVWDRDFPLDPYVVPGDLKSGLLPLVSAGKPGNQGDPAPGVQSYCFRLCLSTAADRRSLHDKPPPHYDPKRYELVVRFIQACQAIGDDIDLRWFSKYDPLPNQKWDFNTATFGANLPDVSQEWAAASYDRRVEIAREIENYHRGLLYFLATDERVPTKVREEMQRFGLPRDEFPDTAGWPHQLYVREGRRMVSDLVVTEHHTHGKQIAPHSIGLGSYGTDTHEVRRLVKDGVVTREGKTAGGRGGFGPYQIGYGAIVPKASECENLFVTFALSASHTAFSSIRMEPVFMVTSQSAATAACLAIDADVPVQQVDQALLRSRLLKDGQILTVAGPAAKPAVKPAAVPKPTPKSAECVDEESKPAKPLRIMPLGDSITRGSYLTMYRDGPYQGKGIGLPHRDGGGWRKVLQDKLRDAKISYDFVGELNYGAYGVDGVIDPKFDPDHQGLAGFSNATILSGGKVPTPGDVLAKLGVQQIVVPGIVEVLKKHQPDVVLLMSGANGFDPAGRDRLIQTIGEHSAARLLVATILPQKSPRAGWDKVNDYNASLPKIVYRQQQAGKKISIVEMNAAISADDLLPDGVHPNQAAMRKMGEVWFTALQNPDVPVDEKAANNKPAANSDDRTRTALARKVAVSQLAAETVPAKVPANDNPREAVQLKTAATADQVHSQTYDVVIYGGTSGGIMCAVRAAREGCSVLLVQHNRHIGGMMANGLMQWDALYGGPRSPLFTELLGNIERHYIAQFGRDSYDHQVSRYTHEHYPIGWVEPHVAEREYHRLLAGEKKITLLYEFYPHTAKQENRLIRSVTFRHLSRPHANDAAAALKEVTVQGSTFVDGSYEGDLLAAAKVAHRVGREGRDEYQEPHAGKVFCNIAQGGPASIEHEGLNIRTYNNKQGSIDPTSPFTADGFVQAYNYRFCVSGDPANQLPIPKPANYDRNEYVNYERKYISATMGPNKKSHVNSPILPGENRDYPEADWPTREKIIQRHLDFGLGLMWFLQHDESVPEAQRKKFLFWGLPKDEFADNHHVPYEMYVREARRLVGRYVFTQHDGMLAKNYSRTPVHPDSIAVTDWYLDSHSCTTDSRPGYKYDGKLILTEESRPAQIPYRSLLAKELDNLLVPVCLSATHVSWGSVRLEPVFMQTGEAAGLAAAMAKDQKITVGTLNADQLVRKLVERRQLVSFFNELKVDAADPRIPAAEYFGTQGFFATYHANLDSPLTEAVAQVWKEGLALRRDGKLDPSALAAKVQQAEKADSKPTGRTRGEVLLEMWQGITSSN